MKKWQVFLFILFLLGSVKVGLGEDFPSPEGKALWQYITRVSPYKNWSFWPNHQGLQPGKAPHGPLHKVFVNSRGIESKKAPVLDRTIVVKENYGKDKQLKAITVMYKVKGYAPQSGDWFWVKYSPQGKIDKEGKVKGCIGCHQIHKYNDYIFLHQFK
ncbi:MAG TPA: hypothetical protein DIT19_01220 [Desulfonauticus sp.]|nr:hypothetical protein [Desulfonauticus sp.]